MKIVLFPPVLILSLLMMATAWSLTPLRRSGGKCNGERQAELAKMITRERERLDGKRCEDGQTKGPCGIVADLITCTFEMPNQFTHYGNPLRRYTGDEYCPCLSGPTCFCNWEKLRMGCPITSSCPISKNGGEECRCLVDPEKCELFWFITFANGSNIRRPIDGWVSKPNDLGEC